MTQIIREETEDRWPVVALSGPSHAEEVGRGVPTGGGGLPWIRRLPRAVQDAVMNDRFRVYTSR